MRNHITVTLLPATLFARRVKIISKNRKDPYRRVFFEQTFTAHYLVELRYCERVRLGGGVTTPSIPEREASGAVHDPE